VESESLAKQTALEIGKPLRYAKAEMSRAIALIQACIGRVDEPLQVQCGQCSRLYYRPLGTVAIVTPWNNPVAIPIGKIVPALFYGNTAVWKPSPLAFTVSNMLMQALNQAGLPSGTVKLLQGGTSTGYGLMSDQGIDGVTITGALAAGYAAQEVCARRLIALQAELGGNNTALVFSDCALKDAADKIAEAAFGFAGQRCTANRRVIVDAECYDEFLFYLAQSAASLGWGDPLDLSVHIGLISNEAVERVAETVERARASGCKIILPHPYPSCKGAFFPPTIICCDDPTHEIVQEETVGPVLVVQKSTGWNHAISLCNGVKHGLTAALFSNSQERRAQFIHQAQAGILKFNGATADADAQAPFGGRKASHIGPPEHGPANREFYARALTIYSYD
jgi:acyl-CoA reductase-like NAD-dependent aldehyde dehydrogenase